MPTPIPGPISPTGVTVNGRPRGRRPLIAALIAFLLAGAAAVGVVRQSEQYRLQEQRAHLTDLADLAGDAIQNSTQRLLSATYALAALVRQGRGSIANFDAIASEMLAFFPGAGSLQLAPGGIVQQIVPLAGNEKAIGHNLLQDPTRNKEAFLARDTGRLTLAGPFELKQGGLGAVGRLPVFLDDSQGKSVFWGFTIVLIRYPQAFQDARLAQLTQQGIGYELWRIHPDSGQKQSIAASSDAALIDPVVRTLNMPNGSWTLSVAPLKGWHEPLWLSLKSALGLLFSLLLGYLAKLLFELRVHERYLEALVLQRTAEISAAQAKLQATFDAIPDLVWLKDAQGIYLDCNPMIERLFGTKKAAILGKTAYDFVGPEQVDSFREHDRQAIAAGQASVNEEWLTFAADGRRGLFEITRTPMRDGDGQLVGVLGIAHDITESKRAQDEILRLNASLEERVQQRTKELEESEQRFRSIFEYSKVGMSVADADIGYLEVNPAFVEMTGYSEEELLRLSFREITHPDDVESSTAMGKTLLTGASDHFQVEKKYIRKDGSTLWADVTVSPRRDAAGKFVSFIGIHQDITERKRTEAALQQELVRHQETARELFDARVWLAETDRQEAVGRLAAGVAHEVKNPLAIIRLGIDYLSKEFARESTQGAVLGKVQQAIMRADSIITDLMQFSRQKSLARHPTQINAVVDNAINLVSHEITVRNIDIVRSYDDSMPPILADPDQLAQVFVNLLSNAAQAIGQGGRIEVVTRSIRLLERDLERDETGTFKIGERVIVAEIRDNGSGVSPDNQKKLFEPFFTTKPIGEGTGLGLAVARNIVIMHEGSINLSNHPEGGASALLMFPVAIEG